ncbi:MAG: hypothetical protein IT582_10210 [Opitutaceae bacterium]|nr:hypothetical protein [Opitutaceae bacterium]
MTTARKRQRSKDKGAAGVIGSDGWFGSSSRIQKLALALGILLNARQRVGSALRARRLHALLRLTQCERNLLSALGADKLKPRAVHRATSSHCAADYLTRWIDVITHEVEKMLLPNVKISNAPTSAEGKAT